MYFVNEVVLNDFGFQDTLYKFTQDVIGPIADLVLPNQDRHEWNFESNYTFSVEVTHHLMFHGCLQLLHPTAMDNHLSFEFEMGEDTDLVLHKDSKCSSFKI